MCVFDRQAVRAGNNAQIYKLKKAVENLVRRSIKTENAGNIALLQIKEYGYIKDNKIKDVITFHLLAFCRIFKFYS